MVVLGDVFRDRGVFGGDGDLGDDRQAVGFEIGRLDFGIVADDGLDDMVDAEGGMKGKVLISGHREEFLVGAETLDMSMKKMELGIG